MAFYLLDNRNPHGDHFHGSRRKPLLAIVIHCTAGLQDLDGTDDQSAENTARYAARTERAVSWHSGSDADSFVQLLPPTFTAFHCKGYNSPTYGHEISKLDMTWANEPVEWVEATLRNTARALAPVVRRYGIPLRLATRAELDHAMSHGGKPVGFLRHSDLDPDRRSDPGSDFPWPRFFELVSHYAHNAADPEEDDMPLNDADLAKIEQIVDEKLRAVMQYAIGVILSGQSNSVFSAPANRPEK